MVMNPAPTSSAAPPARTALAAAAEVVAPERVRLREDAFHLFHLTVDEREFLDVRPVRAFPISGKADYVGFMDAQGKEVALVAHPQKMDRASRQALERAFSRVYYVPKIQRIDKIEETWGVSHWQVDTDRGYASFEVVDREYIRKLGGARFLIIDADGNRFEIENAARLDVRSQTLLHSEI